MIEKYGHPRVGLSSEMVVLGERRADAMLFKTLATLKTDAPLFDNVEAIRWTSAKPEFAALAATMGAEKLVKRCEECRHRTQSDSPTV